jgi:CTP:molybdopterin cytidylyltransferase MocA
VTDPTHSPGATVAAILAAGAGSRFAGDVPKVRAEVRGRPLVVWAVESALAGGLDAVIVVSGAAPVADLLPPGVIEVPNARWADGQATSLQAAVAWADAHGFDAVVVGLADQPFVPPSAWGAVAASPASLAAASFHGRRRPPVRLARSVWPLLPVDGDDGARVLMRRHPELVVDVPCEGDPTDIDTLEDLAPWN